MTTKNTETKDSVANKTRPGHDVKLPGLRAQAQRLTAKKGETE